jgi:TP901 family phage tail tape measure protein
MTQTIGLLFQVLGTGNATSALGSLAKGMGAVAVAKKALDTVISSTKVYMNFEYAMNKVAAVSGATSNELAKLTEQAKHLGATTALAASDVAKLQYELSTLGFNPQEIINMTASVGNLSIALGTNLGDTAQFVGNILRQFQKDAKQATNVADIMALTASRSATTMESLGESFKFAGSAAGNLGIDVTDTAAAIGVLGNVGLKGTLAGVGMNRMMLDMTDASSEASKKLKGFTGDAGDFVGKLQYLKAQGMSVNEIFSTFGMIAGKSAVALINNADAVYKLDKELENASGTTDKMAKKMGEGLRGAVIIAQSSFEAMQISLGKLFSTPATFLVNQFANLTTEAKKFFDHLSGEEKKKKKEAQASAEFNKADKQAQLDLLLKIKDAENDVAKAKAIVDKGTGSYRIAQIKLANQELNEAKKDFTDKFGGSLISDKDKVIAFTYNEGGVQSAKKSIATLKVELEALKKSSPEEEKGFGVSDKEMEEMQKAAAEEESRKKDQYRKQLTADERELHDMDQLHAREISNLNGYSEEVIALAKLVQDKERKVLTDGIAERQKAIDDAQKKAIKDAEERAENLKKAEEKAYKEIDDQLTEGAKRHYEAGQKKKEQDLKLEEDRKEARDFIFLESMKAVDRDIELARREYEEKKILFADNSDERLNLERLFQEEKARIIKDAQEKEVETEDEIFARKIELAKNYWDAFASFGDAFANKQLSAVQERASAEIDTIENRDKKLTRAEREKENAIKAIKKKASEDEYKIRMAQWTMDMLSAGSAMGLAIARANAVPPPGNIPAIAFATTNGLFALGTVGLNMPQKPKFANGGIFDGTGIVPGTAYTGDTVNARLNSGEIVLNPQQQQNVGSAIMGVANGRSTTNQTANFGGITVNSYGGESPQEMARKMVDAMTYAVNNRMIPTEVWSV